MNLQPEAEEKKGPSLSRSLAARSLGLGRHICYVLSFSHSQIPPEKERKKDGQVDPQRSTDSTAQHLRGAPTHPIPIRASAIFFLPVSLEQNFFRKFTLYRLWKRRDGLVRCVSCFHDCSTH